MGRSKFSVEVLGDEEPRNDEENIDTNETPGQQLGKQVVPKNQGNRQGAEPLDVGALSHARATDGVRNNVHAAQPSLDGS